MVTATQPREDRLVVVSTVGLHGQALADYKTLLAEEAEREKERQLKAGISQPKPQPVTVTFSR